MSSGKKNTYKERIMRRKEEEKKKLDPETPRYRDRAKERREDQNPDYEASELGSFHAVAPPGTVDLRLEDAQKLSIEKSKYLGGDLEHTHLVKGLDYALLNKVRSEIDKKPDSEDGKDGKSRAIKEDTNVSFRTATAKSVYKWMIKPQIAIKSNEMFLPGRMAFVYNMEDGFTHDIPTTLHRSKDDCPNIEDMINVNVDGSVLDRIAKIMSYLRLGSSGKVLKKKKKEKDPKLKFGSNQEEGEITNQTNNNNNNNNNNLERETLPPPPPPPPRMKNNYEKAPENEVEEETDIFLGEGVEYKVPNKEIDLSPVYEDMEESPKKERESFFEEPLYGPVAPSQTWQPTEGYYDPTTESQMMPAGGYPGAEWSFGSGYPEPYPIPSNYPDNLGTEQLELIGTEQYELMSQAEKDRGFGSVFKRDDERLVRMREKDERERDPNFVSESYSECYPAYQEYNRELVDDDDDTYKEELSKMDMGGRAKGRLHRWDFETEEEWAKYNDQKEAMPKAAFQFGVKMQDGRKTRKNNKDQKLSNDLHKINKILARKKGEKDGGGDGGYDDDLPSGKKSRV